MRAAPDLVPGAINFRDIGGLRAGRARTRFSVLYRSGNLAHLRRKGVDALGGLRVRRIIDLRADDEVERDPSRTTGLDLHTQRVPLFLGSVRSYFAEDISLAQLYRLLVDESSAGVVDVVRGIIADQPVLVHCTVGKDRTGLTVALTLRAAGVDLDEVVADYALTESFLPASRSRRVIKRLTKMHPEAVHLEELATRSPAPVMQGLLDDVESEFGSVADWLRSQGLRDDEVTELGRVLITESEDSP